MYQRWEYTKKGDSVDLIGGLFLDMCQQKRLLLNGVRVDLKIFPNTDEFVLISNEPDGGSYSFQIQECVLKVCQVTLNPALLVAHSEAIKTQPAIYNFMQSDVRAFSITPGTHTYSTDDVFNGIVPSQVVVGLVDSEGYAGAINKNPYAFENFDVTQIGFFVDGQSCPEEMLSLDFKKGLYAPAYLNLFTGIDKYTPTFGNDIKREDFANGYTLFVFRIDGAIKKEYMKLMRKGHTRLYIKFGTPLEKTVTAIVYGQYPRVIEIDQARNIRL